MSAPWRRFSRITLSVLSGLVMALWLCGPVVEVALAQTPGMPGPNPPVTPQAPGMPVAVVANVPAQVDGIWKNVAFQLGSAVIVGFLNAVQVFAGQIAYDAAMYVASGGKGKEPMFFEKGWDYWKDVAGSAGGEFIGTLSDRSFFKDIGFNLCQPSDPRTLLRVQLGLGNLLSTTPRSPTGIDGPRPKPRCEFKDIVNNYQNVYTSLSNWENYDNINNYFNMNSNELGVSLNIMNQFQRKLATKLDEETLNRMEGKGIKAVTDMVSGRVKTPSTIVNDQMSQYLVKYPDASQRDRFNNLVNNVSHLSVYSLVGATLSIFLNTLTSQFMKKIFEDGLISNLFHKKGVGVSVSLDPDAVNQIGTEDIRDANVSLRNPVLFQETNLELIAEMSVCPQEGRGTWNCVMDQAMSQALRSEGADGKITIAEAMERGYLHEDWRLIPSTMFRENQDTNCYTYGYCINNLRKMRLLRILPVGLEFAADAKANVERCNSTGGCVTLKEVVAGFSKPCTPENPWCKLVDPNWLITSFPQKCNLNGYGDTLMSRQLNVRRQECSDVQTCLKRNDRGECIGGYGYCLAERTVYRFDADECPERYASCRTYGQRNGEPVSYLKNTLDYANCSADNVGCLRYATRRSPTGQENAWAMTTTGGEDMYFDKTLETCPSTADGCTKVALGELGLSGLNLLVNPSFETIEYTTIPTTREAVMALKGWVTARLPYEHRYFPPEMGASSTHGTYAGIPTSARAEDGFKQLVRMEPSRTYTISAFVRRAVPRISDPRRFYALVQQYQDADGTVRVTNDQALRDFRSNTCSPAVVDNNRSTVQLEGRPTVTDETARESTWESFECTFTASAQTQSAMVTFYGENVAFDSVQLEESEFATDFVDGINGNLPIAHIKLPPTELRCTGSSTDVSACSSYAKMCTQAEAGCEGYADDFGNPEIPAIATDNDRCPASCVGYTEYRKSASAFDLVQEADPALNAYSDASDGAPSYFIASTAKQCSQAQVGCEAFTNIGAAGAGGETSAYFSYIRACEKPDADSQTYFTWEGSESAGYQLRTWSLQKRTTAKPGAVPPEGAYSAGAPAGPRVLVKRTADQLRVKLPATCNESTWRGGADPDCRQFYDAAGNTFYRYYSQTVLSTPDCQSYRITRTNTDDCTKTGGVFTTQNNECVYQGFVPESLTCTQEAVGCRAYAGAESGNIQVVLAEAFRSTTSTGKFRGSIATNRGNEWNNILVSTEALLVGDQSLRWNAVAGTSEVRVAIPAWSKSTYQLSFWAKAPGTPLSISVLARDEQSASPAADVALGNVNLTADWQRFVVGPFNGLRDVATTTLVWTGSLTGGRSVFLDEVVVRQLPDMAYVVRDSWNTPAVCDVSSGGVPEPHAMVGCKNYTDRQAKTQSLRRFTRLCRETSIGCRQMVDTRNSASIGAETFTREDEPAIPGFGQAKTVRPADRLVYAIDAPESRCSAENASCRAFGKPILSQDRQSIARFETVYFKDDITKYSQGLCRPSENYCEEYAYGAGKTYFRDPQNHVCQYKPAVEIAAGNPYNLPPATYSGWFESDSNKPCYSQALQGGSFFNILRVGDVGTAQRSGYAGWGGLCPQEYGECTEFRDPNDKSDAQRKTGKPYFFVKNDRLDLKSCGGKVDTARGCVLLRDMTDTMLKYNTAASYAQYAANSFRASDPVDCVANPTSPNCGARAGRCSGKVGVYLIGFPQTPVVEYDFEQLETLFRQAGATEAQLAPVFACQRDSDCVDAQYSPYPGNPLFVYRREGRCGVGNDANIVAKVGLDRDCAQWLGCSSAETVYDDAQNKYMTMCTNLAMCDQPSTREGDIFCSRYVDRNSTASEPILARGAYFDENLYQSRAIGLGNKDYSGMAIPNAFQAQDLVNTRVAFDGLERDRSFADIKQKFALDYRLSIAVPMAQFVKKQRSGTEVYELTGTVGPNDAVIPNGDTTVAAAKAQGILLCRHQGTGRYGYYTKSEFDVYNDTGKPMYCYLPWRADMDAYDFHKISAEFKNPEPDKNPLVRNAFPSPECRAEPEADSPYPASYVTEWDNGKNPPKAKAKAVGYAAANTCEEGEICECAYKRVTFDGLPTPKFYGQNSQNVPAGICFGGPRDGQACLPSTVFQPGATSTLLSVAEGANESMNCGPVEGGGQCMAFSKVEIVRGVQGQCLERDLSQPVGGTRDQFACLTWNPSPVLFGENDIFHYTPTAGYLPPQNAGQYYCLSQAKPPRAFAFTDEFFGELPGSMNKITYHDEYTSSGECAFGIGGCDGGEVGADPFGRSPMGSSAGELCEQADDQEQDLAEGSDHDDTVFRLVNTGRESTESFTEMVFRVDGMGFSKAIDNVDDPSPSQRLRALVETNFGFFKFNIIKPRFEHQWRLCCGYQPDWVSGIDVDCDDDESIEEFEPKFLQSFEAEFPGMMSRVTEEIFSARDSGNPYFTNCLSMPGVASESDKCFFKTWETGYKDKGQSQKFEALINTEPGQREKLVRNFQEIIDTPVKAKCESGSPWFSIRALFQTRADKAPFTFGTPAAGEIKLNQVADAFTVLKEHKGKIRGPWYLAGFWVSSCAGEGRDDRWMYFSISGQSADTCKELAEVRSATTNQDAAFTDRVWKESGYVVPMLGINYSRRFAPFSSALNTKPLTANTEPLFQAGGALIGFSKLNPPTFLGAGANTYYSGAGAGTPAKSYAYLSNLFARIYRIYRYFDTAVVKTDSLCAAGPNKGKKCYPTTYRCNGADCGLVDESYVDKYSFDCGYRGACEIGGAPPTTKLCNAMSGINTGLPCEDNADKCHLAALNPQTKQPLYTACELQPNWVQDGPEWRQRNAQGVLSGGMQAAAAINAGALKCAIDAVKTADGQRINCSAPSAKSTDCPLEIYTRGSACDGDPTSATCKNSAQCVKATGATWGNCKVWIDGAPYDTKNDRMYSPCLTDYDCTFSAEHHWMQRPTALGGNVPSTRSAGAQNDDGKRINAWQAEIDLVKFTYDDLDYFAEPYRSQWNATVGISDGFWGRNDQTYVGIRRDGYPTGKHELHRFPHADYSIEWKPERGDSTQSHAVRVIPIAGCTDVAKALEPKTNPRTGRRGGPVTDLSLRDYGQFGQCGGGTYAGSACIGNAIDMEAMSSEYTCGATLGNIGEPDIRARRVEGVRDGSMDICLPVTGADGTPSDYSRTFRDFKCAMPPGTADSSDPDADNNACTHGIGYRPMWEICPVPTDEFCGLISYNMKTSAMGISMDPKPTLLPTDVTMGHYRPTDVGFRAGADGTAYSNTDFRYIDSYTPVPPRVAAVDARNCPSPGKCPVMRMDMFAFNGQAEGGMAASGGQFIGNIKFYGWAAHDQMPIRKLVVDWGDGKQQAFPDAKIRNHKPFCSAQKECYSPGTGHSGLTCESDNDCPPGLGSCKPIGTCASQQGKACTADADCQDRAHPGDTCKLRTMFGDSAQACDANYFEFSHLYTCTAKEKLLLPSCQGTNQTVAAASASVIPPRVQAGGVCYYGNVGGNNYDRILMTSVLFCNGDADCSARPTCTGTGTAGQTECWDKLVAANTANRRFDLGADGLFVSSAGVPNLREQTSCGASLTPVPPAARPAGTMARCSGDPARFCGQGANPANPTENVSCAAGDRCVASGLAPNGGCWDNVMNACRYTPRLFLQDNWGWCSGECRNLVGPTGLTDNRATSPAIHPNGGCWAGETVEGKTNIHSNMNVNASVLQPAAGDPIGECSLSNPPTPTGMNHLRPWIVYPGALQLGPTGL
ncbi:MAG: hypothetical protein WCV84_01790 [Patescibacteria group bacterium]